MDWFALRLCRHCRRAVGFDDKVCKHCKHKLMEPGKFKVYFYSMIIILLLVYAALLILSLSVLRLSNQLSCQQPEFYQRATAAQGSSCTSVCTAACTKKGYGAGNGLLLTVVQTEAAETLSCDCTCSVCA